MKNAQPSPDPLSLIRTNRKITGMSAILLPFKIDGGVDWSGLEQHLQRTVDCGLVPAVNMDTGFANLIDEPTRQRVLDISADICDGSMFVAGAYVADCAGDEFNLDGYRESIDAIVRRGGTPVIFQSFGLVQQADRAIVDSYAAIGQHAEQFIAFELSDVFAPFGKIYNLPVYRELMAIPQCLGAKHSSLRRSLEWQRIELRNEVRPEFLVLTGNDWAIDMVIYGSDYLLGISTFAPDLFAQRDALWAAGDVAGFFELNDHLQYLGNFAFRHPVPAYKHNAAQFLKLRGWIDCDDTHPRSLRRPETDVVVLQEIAERLGIER